jgi:arsenite methyltransferase
MFINIRKKYLIGIVFVLILAISPMTVLAGQQHTLASAQRFDNIEFWVKAFEDPARDAWQKPDEVIKIMDLKQGDVVADLGAGTGYFTRRIAAAVGPEGKAFGLEVEPAMVEYMKKDAEKLRLTNYIAKLVKYDDPLLEPRSVDVVFICDTYHHIEDRVNYLKRLSKGLKTGGRVVIVDFYKKELPVGPQDLEHKLSEETVLKEFQDAGYRVLRTHCVLPYQYFIEFGM